MSNELTSKDVRGIISPVVTPFDEHDEVAFDAFRAEVRFILQFGVTGLLIGAATGEGYALTPEESGALYRAAVEETDGRVPIVAGILCTSTRDAVDRAKRAAMAGAAAVLATPVYYFPPSDDGMVAYYQAIAEEGGLPVIVYNSLAHTPVRPAVMERIADLPGVIGLKEGGGGTLDTLSQILYSCGDKIGITWSQ